MSPLDNYQQEISPTENPEIAPTSLKKKHPKKFLILAVISVLLIIGIAVGSILFLRNSDKQEAAAGDPANSQQNPVVDTTASSSEIGTESNLNSEPGTLSIEEIENQRQKVVEAATKKDVSSNIETLTAGSFTSLQVAEIKNSLGSDAVSISIEPGKKVKLDVRYSSIGDQNFENASLYVKLSDGLNLVPGSVKDSFKGGSEINVADELYNAKDKLLIYGPGSSSKTSSPLKIGETGTLSFVVEIDPSVSEVFGVASYIKEEGGKIGQPSIFFIDLNK